MRTLGRDAGMLRQMVKMSSERGLLLAAAGLLVVGVVVGLMSGTTLHVAGCCLRWVGIGLLGVFALRRRSLTPWIFVAMVAGAELGFDEPAVAVSLRVFSDIFLRLIKTIVAPLILATMVTGVAGHGDLKS
ncbi:MAG: sodium:dicarboxylate symporter, partial [Edaphobacter sp.]|nr:sodium:dicarboxylate symporter [Edaphobacter sp.]